MIKVNKGMALRGGILILLVFLGLSLFVTIHSFAMGIADSTGSVDHTSAQVFSLLYGMLHFVEFLILGVFFEQPTRWLWKNLAILPPMARIGSIVGVYMAGFALVMSYGSIFASVSRLLL